MINNKHLVIFDCDGVLVDSEWLAAEVFSQTLLEQGVSLSAGECMAEFKGLTLNDCLEKLERLTGKVFSTEFLDLLKLRTEQCFAKQLQPVRGVEQVLNKLSEKEIQFCVASNGGLDKIRHSLKITGLDAFFEARVFSAEQVSRGKPNPDLFLFAAQEMGFTTEQCWVVEDSYSGVSAAVKAGMQVIWYQAEPDFVDESVQKTAPEPNYVLQDLNLLVGFID